MNHERREIHLYQTAQAETPVHRIWPKELNLGMNTSDAFGVFLPDEGLDELFDMVKFEKTDNAALKR